MLHGLKSTYRQWLLSILVLQRTLHIPSEELPSQTRLARVDFQLDYHLSSQFARLVYAQHQGIYAKHGLDVSLLTAPPAAGGDPALVSRMQEELGQQRLVLGSVEQNTPVAAQIYGQLPIRAVSAMLHSTPLAIAAPPGSPVKTFTAVA